MKIKSNIATSENGFIFNPATGDSFSGNGMAALLLLAMKGGKSENEIKQDILNRYNVNQAQLDLDWEDWMLQLKEANLLETEA
jgi:hypothetical protein